MQIQYFGLSSFKITTKEATIITDPFHKDSGLTPPRGAADILITVGDRARFMSNEALARGMSEEKIFSFSTTEEAADKLEEILQKGDLILIKGSRAMRMENIVQEIMAHSEDAVKLLVRH